MVRAGVAGEPATLPAEARKRASAGKSLQRLLALAFCLGRVVLVPFPLADLAVVIAIDGTELGLDLGRPSGLLHIDIMILVLVELREHAFGAATLWGRASRTLCCRMRECRGKSERHKSDTDLSSY